MIAYHPGIKPIRVQLFFCLYHLHLHLHPLSSVFCLPLLLHILLLSSVFCLLSSIFCLLSSVFSLLYSVFCLLYSVWYWTSVPACESYLYVREIQSVFKNTTWPDKIVMKSFASACLQRSQVMPIFINRPGVAGAVLQSPLSFRNYLID